MKEGGSKRERRKKGPCVSSVRSCDMPHRHNRKGMQVRRTGGRSASSSKSNMRAHDSSSCICASAVSVRVPIVARDTLAVSVLVFAIRAPSPTRSCWVAVTLRCSDGAALSSTTCSAMPVFFSDTPPNEPHSTQASVESRVAGAGAAEDCVWFGSVPMSSGLLL